MNEHQSSAGSRRRFAGSRFCWRGPWPLLLFALLFAAIVGAAPAAAQISLTNAGPAVELSNGRISLTVQKATGNVTSLRLDGGPDVFGGDRYLYFDANGHGPEHPPKDYWRPSRGQLRLVRVTPQLIELEVSTTPDARYPFDIQQHLILRAGDPGFYLYIAYHHPAGLPPGEIGQTRVVLKLREDLMTHYFVNDQEQGKLPKAPDPAHPPVKVTDATYRFPDGTIATKYNLADFEEDHHVHGMTGAHDGVWMISASSEYVNGGPTKQDRCDHQDTAIVLKMLQSSHFLPGVGISAEGPWDKLYGPFFVYLNTGPTPEAMWQDAKQRAALEVSQWPYAWMQDPLYPLARGTVTGRVLLSNGRPAVGAHVILSDPGPDWQLLTRGYFFWTRTGKDGGYSVANVRPGKYTVTAYADNTTGQAVRNGVTIVAHQAAHLSPLVCPLPRGLLWQVGVGDRSAGEFRYGDWPRQFGLWNRYPADFPHDVDFTIGKSHERTDWNYCEPVVRGADGRYHLPEWRIHFTVSRPPRGAAALQVGVAGASHVPAVLVSVNGQVVGEIHPPSDPSVYRDGNKAGHFASYTFPFRTSLLHPGRNVAALRIEAAVPNDVRQDLKALPLAAIMYDFVRMTIAPTAHR